MHNVFKGIVVGFIGLVIWLLFSVLWAVTDFMGDEAGLWHNGMYLGFAIMLGGPIIYIVVLPVAGWLRRRRA